MSRRSFITKEQKQKGGGDIARAFLREESHHVSYHQSLMANSTLDSRTHHVMDTLDAFVDANDKLSETENTLVIGSDVGCGKSTILSHWTEERRKAYPDEEFIIYHHAQASDEAKKIPHSLERWIWLMGRYMRVSGEHPQIDSLIEGTTSEALLMQRFSRFCTMLTNGFRGPSGKGGYNGFTSESSKTRSTISEQPRDKQRLILVVDGADLMRLEDGTESLRWLPTKLPKRVSVILSLSLPAPLEERRSNSQKIEVSKSLLKLPAHLQEQLCFRIIKMSSYIRPEYIGLSVKTLGECWRRKYFIYPLEKMTMHEQREFITNYLTQRTSDYNKFVAQNEPQFQNVVSRPSFRHTKAKHEVQRLCRETGPTGSPHVMSLLLQAACLASAEDVHEDIMYCFDIVSMNWEENKKYLTEKIRLKLFNRFYELIHNAIIRGCVKLKLKRLSKPQFADGTDDVTLKVTFFQAIISLLGASRFGLQQVELWNCMEKLNPEWHINEIGKIRPFVMWTLRFHVMSILYNHRDPDTFDDASSKSEKEKDDNQIVGLSLFQAVKLKNLSRKIKTQHEEKKNEPWWYIQTKSGSTMWHQQLMTFPSSSCFWQAFMFFSPENEKVIYAAHNAMSLYFDNHPNKQRAVEELTLHGLITENWIMLKRLTVQISSFLQYWRSEGGVNRRDLIKLWCAKSSIVPSAPLDTRFDIIKEYVNSIDVWWERVRLNNNGDQNAADKSTSVVMKDIDSFFNACVMLYHNRYTDAHVYPEFDRENVIDPNDAFLMLSNEVNEIMTANTGSRRRASSISDALEEALSPKASRSPTAISKSNADYEYDEDTHYVGDAARFATWLKRWKWVQLPYKLMINSVKGATVFKKAVVAASSQSVIDNNNKYARKTILPDVKSPLSRTSSKSKNGRTPTSRRRSSNKKKKSRLVSSTEKKKSREKNSPFKMQEGSTTNSDSITSSTGGGFLQGVKKKVEKSKLFSPPRLLTKDDVPTNPLDVLKMGKYGANDQKEEMVKILQETILEKQRELSNKKLFVKTLENKIRLSTQEIRDLTLVDSGVTIDPVTGKATSPGIIHVEQKVQDIGNKQMVQQWLTLFFHRLKELCEKYRPENLDYIQMAGEQVANLNRQIEQGERTLDAVNIENKHLESETLPAYIKNYIEYRKLNKETLIRIEKGVDAIHREEEQRMERIKKKEQYIKDMENARKQKRMLELQESQMQQAMLSMGLSGMFERAGTKGKAKLSKAEIKKAIKAANIPKLVNRLEKSGVEEPSEILPKLLAQGRSFNQMDKNSKELEKTKEERSKQLQDLRERLHEMEFGHGGGIEESDDEEMGGNANLGGDRRQAIRMTQGHLFKLQSQIFKDQEKKMKKKSSRKQELLNYDTKISKLDSQARIFRERLIHDISLLNDVEHGLMHLGVLTGSEEAKTLLLAEANSGEDFSSDSDSDDEYNNDGKGKRSYELPKSFELKEKSKTGFKASIRSKYALRKILARIKNLEEEMKSFKDKKKRNQRRSVITGELLEDIPTKSIKSTKRVSTAEKKEYEENMEQQFYEDGMPIPRRPISRIVDVRRNTLDIAATNNEATFSNDEDSWWKEALFESSSNAARRKVQEKKQKEKERKERIKQQAIQRRIEQQRKKEEEERRRIELQLWEEAEKKRLEAEALRKQEEEEKKRKKKAKRRGKGKYRSRSMYTRGSKSAKKSSKVKKDIKKKDLAATTADSSNNTKSNGVGEGNAY